MKIAHVRDTYFDDTTMGKVWIDGQYFCEVLEDADLQLELFPERKVKGATAIPRGTYKVGITFSNRFQKDMLELFAVPGFHGIRVHAGNTHLDTDGCPLVGFTRYKRTIRSSGAARDALFARVKTALDSGKNVTWTVT